MALTPEDVSREYQQAVDTALKAMEDTEGRYNYYVARLNALSEEERNDDRNTEVVRLSQQMKELEATLAKTRDQYATILRQRADAMARARESATTPEEKAAFNAKIRADEAAAKAREAEAKVALETIPEKVEAARSQAATAKRQAQVADLEYQEFITTAPERKAELQVRIELLRKQAAQVGQPAPRTPEQTRIEGARATQEEATASVAGDRALAELRQAQAQADQAELALQDARRRASVVTDENLRRAAEAEIASKEKALEQATFNLEQARKLAPLAVEQTQQQLDKTRLGSLYGVQDRARQIRDMLASGELGTGPEAQAKAQSLLQDYVQAEIRGTTIYDAQRQQTADETSRIGQRLSQRQQDASLQGQRLSTFGGMVNQGLGTFAQMNQYANPGSTAGGDAFLALLNIAQERLNQFQAPAPVEVPSAPNYLGGSSGGGGVEQLIAAAQAQLQQTPAPAQPQGGGVTINIGGGQPTQPAPQPGGQTGLAAWQQRQQADVAAQQQQRSLAGSALATPEDVLRLYGRSAGDSRGRGGF